MPAYLGSYEWITTEDQSPSLKWQSEDSEWMHSSGGAYAETQYIYGEAARLSLKAESERFLSVGFGLGYNELLSFAESEKMLKKPPRLLYSFEADPFLYECFLAWLKGRLAGAIPAELAVYEKLYSLFERDYGSELMLKASRKLYEAYLNKNWQLCGRLEEFERWSETPGGFHCIYYDAFSSKSSPELWGENYLEDFLKKAAAKTCVLSTYACTGALKRSLKKQAFEVNIRKGFHVKKESILAIR